MGALSLEACKSQHKTVGKAETGTAKTDGSETLLEETLQSFANKVGIVCALENGNKMPPHEAYKQIKALFKELKEVKRSVYPSRP